MAVAFILIHGTLSNTDIWTVYEGRNLEGTLGQYFGEAVRCELFKWSGWFTFGARLKAARALRALIRDKFAEDSDAQIYIVAHSHGGSIVAYALKEDQDLAKRVRGVVFLACPFLDVRPKPDRQALVFYFGLAVSLLAGVILAVGALLGVAKITGVSFQHPAIGLLGGAIPLALAGWYAASQGRQAGEKKLDQRLRHISEQISCASLPPGKYLFLRTGGDEAGSLLSALQFANVTLTTIFRAAGSLLTLTLSLPARWLVNELQTERRPEAPVIRFFAVSIGVGLAVLGYVFLAGAFMITERLALVGLLYGLGGVQNYAARLPTVGLLLHVAIPVIPIATIVIALVATLLSSLVHGVMGRMLFLSGGLVDITTEVIPYGQHMVQSLEPHPGPFDIGRMPVLRHSQVWMSPSAQHAIAAWAASIDGTRSC